MVLNRNLIKFLRKNKKGSSEEEPFFNLIFSEEGYFYPNVGCVSAAGGNNGDHEGILGLKFYLEKLGRKIGFFHAIHLRLRYAGCTVFARAKYQHCSCLKL